MDSSDSFEATSIPYGSARTAPFGQKRSADDGVHASLLAAFVEKVDERMQVMKNDLVAEMSRMVEARVSQVETNVADLDRRTAIVERRLGETPSEC